MTETVTCGLGLLFSRGTLPPAALLSQFLLLITSVWTTESFCSFVDSISDTIYIKNNNDKLLPLVKRTLLK